MNRKGRLKGKAEETAPAVGILQLRAPLMRVQATIWHSSIVSFRIRTHVHVETGAGVGDYASMALTKAVEVGGIVGRGGGGAIVNPTRKELIVPPIPNSIVPPMTVVGSCLLPLVFVPIDRVFRATVWVAPGFPYALDLGATFMREHRNAISFYERRGGGG